MAGLGRDLTGGAWCRALTLAGAITTVLAAAIALLGIGGAAQASTASATHLVPGYLSGLPLATRLGPAPAAEGMTIGIELQRPDPAGEAALLHRLSTPGSPDYHHFLTPAQFTQRFGVSAAQQSALRHWLTGGGLTVTSASGDYVLARGTVAQLDRLLRISIGRYTFERQRFVAASAPPSVPTALPIAGIAGLDSVHRFVPAALHGHALRHATAVGPQAGSQNEFTPQELWSIYNDPGAGALTRADGTSSPSAVASSTAALGQGQTIGIFGEGETSSVIAQLRLFEAAMGLPKVPVRVHHTEGGTDAAYGDNTGSIEWYLDSQAATGMAPDVSALHLYFAKTLFDADIFQDFHAWANDPNGPRQMNASFGECEANPTNPVTGPLAQQPYGTELGDELQAMGDPILRQAALEGRTLFASAGDTGSGCPELVAPIVGAGNGVAIQPVPFVGYPCDSQYVTCVGGTVVSAQGTTYPSAAKRTAETSWTYTGGGSSRFITQPDYQHGVANINQRCLSTPTGSPYPPTSAPLCRGVPDVADLSGNITGDGYFIYSDGQPFSEGGTSLSSPLMLGQWARVQSAASHVVQGRGGLGFANPVIYRQARDADTCSASPCGATYERDFFDVTDSELGAGNGAFQPGAGWDYVTGWGALDVANFTHDVDGTTHAAAATTGPERAAVPVTTAAMTSPVGNATNPTDVSAGNDPSLDLSKATLSTTGDGRTIVATVTGPSLGSTPSAAANRFVVAWEYRGEVYYAAADQASQNSFTFTSGNTGTYGKSSTYGYNDTTNSAATGSFDAATHTVTIRVPASEVGSPARGSALTVPQAFSQASGGVTAPSTTDSSDDLAPVSRDGGLADSVGESVIVGGAPAPAGSSSPPITVGGPSCRTGGPVVHGPSRISRTGIVAHGTASNRGCRGRISVVTLAIARVVGNRCRFLGANHRFGRLMSCRPRSYALRARGTTRWSYRLHQRLAPGLYLLWFRATNSQRNTTKNPRNLHEHLRLR